jgi:transcriptional regulator with XRE-family HTH domain
VAKKEERPNLVDQLREAIRESGQSLYQLGQTTGVSRDRISRFLRGERSIDVEAAAKLCEALGYHLEKDKPRRERKAKGNPDDN